MRHLVALGLFIAITAGVPPIAFAAASTSPTETVSVVASLAQSLGEVSGKLDSETSERVLLGEEVRRVDNQVHALAQASNFKWNEALTALVALLAFGLSVYSLRRQRPRVVVSASVALVGNLDIAPLARVISLSAANTGGGRVVLSSYGLFLPNNQNRVMSEPAIGSSPLPCVVEGGGACLITMDLAYVANSLRRAGNSGVMTLTPFFRDQLGLTHESSAKRRFLFWRKQAKFRLNIDEFATITMPSDVTSDAV